MLKVYFSNNVSFIVSLNFIFNYTYLLLTFPHDFRVHDRYEVIILFHI